VYVFFVVMGKDLVWSGPAPDLHIPVSTCAAKRRGGGGGGCQLFTENFFELRTVNEFAAVNIIVHFPRVTIWFSRDGKKRKGIFNSLQKKLAHTGTVPCNCQLHETNFPAYLARIG
jgi:hypothetical protein